MADNQEVLELIEQAAKQGWTELDLSNKQLINLPPEIAKITTLTKLILTGNRLTGVPSEIANLTNLRFLKLVQNELTSLPLAITKLTNLFLLDLGTNHLLSVRSEIGNLTNLTFLGLDHNQLTSIPPGITKLPKLTRLYLSGNQLVKLSPEIGNLINLTVLYLGQNRLMSLPPEIAKLTNLVELSVWGNQLKNLPPEIINLSNLAELNLTSNPLPIPPETLADAGNVKAIFAAIAGLQSGERLNEAKMLVVGDGKVGKSSVVERLLYDTFNPQKETTLGVEINDEMKIVQSEMKGEGESVKLNIWDFGGQEIQHSTHQFFLTTRSLYLLVVDARKGDQISNIEYWLKLIESFGGDSPIIVIVNQIDQLKGQRELNLDRNALKAKYNIRDFVPTSCATGEGIPQLNEAITREVEQLKHVRDIWPREWLAIKRRLKDIQADYIPVETYLDICGKENLNDPDLRESLLGLLHDLGTVIRFPGDTQVLNPRWVTQGVYGLLTSAQLVKAQGQFDLKNVGEILATSLPDAPRRYPPHTHERLIKVMQHFQLCFGFTDRPDHYLIPRHLHDNELDIPWDDSDALNFQYHYVETLPDSIISRFIVRMNQYIQKQYYWKNGVFLQSGANRAKVKADLVDRKIFISVVGRERTRRAFLAVIRSAFDEINSSFKIEIKRLIPLPDYPSVLISYDELIVYENNNKVTYFVAARGVERDYDVRYLLDGIEELSVRMERRERESLERRFPPHMPEKLQPKPLPPVQSPKSPTSSILPYALVFVLLLGAIVAAAIAISNWVSVTAGVTTGVIIIAALLAVGVIGAMQLRYDDRLSEDSFLKLMIESYKRLPLLKGGGSKDQLEE